MIAQPARVSRGAGVAALLGGVPLRLLHSNWERRHAAMPRCRTMQAVPCCNMQATCAGGAGCTPTHHAPSLTRRGRHKLGRGCSAAHPCDAEGPGRESRDNNVHKVAQWEAGRAAAREGGCSSAATAAWLGLKRPLTPPHATDSRRGSLEQHASSPSTLGCRFRPPRGWEGPPAGQLGPTSLVGPEWHAGRLGWLPRHSPARGQRLLALQRLLDAIRCCCHREGVRQPQKRAEAEPLEHFGAAPAAR